MGEVFAELDDLEPEASPRSLELREGGLRDVWEEAWLLSVRAGREEEATSGIVTPAATSIVVGLSMYFSISRSLFHLMCRSNRLAVLIYFTRKERRKKALISCTEKRGR